MEKAKLSADEERQGEKESYWKVRRYGSVSGICCGLKGGKRKKRSWKAGGKTGWWDMHTWEQLTEDAGKGTLPNFPIQILFHLKLETSTIFKISVLPNWVPWNCLAKHLEYHILLQVQTKIISPFYKHPYFDSSKSTAMKL